MKLRLAGFSTHALLYLFAATIAAAQQADLPSAPSMTSATSTVERTETTVALGVAPQLTAQRIASAQALDLSAAVLGSFRQSFRPWFGYTVHLGYTRTTERNGFDAPNMPHFDIPSNVYEVSGAYLLQRRLSPRLTGFTEVGAGALIFLPVHRGSDAINYVPKAYGAPPPVTFRPLGTAGIGVDYAFSPHWGFRAEYRGLIYKYADFGLNLGRSVTLSSQPTVSLVYRAGSSGRHH